MEGEGSDKDWKGEMFKHLNEVVTRTNLLDISSHDKHTHTHALTHAQFKSIFLTYEESERERRYQPDLSQILTPSNFPMMFCIPMPRCLLAFTSPLWPSTLSSCIRSREGGKTRMNGPPLSFSQ